MCLSELTLSFKVFDCQTDNFLINGVHADSDDFGRQYDDSPSDDVYCGNMVFVPSDPSQSILDKYGITEQEYWCIAEKLQDGLSFGACDLCS